MLRRFVHALVNRRFPGWSSAAVRCIGHQRMVAAVFAAMLAWLVFGLAAQFPAEWLLATNLVCTMVILLLLLLVQHSQNRDMRALQVKLDALITSSAAGNHWVAAERLDAIGIEAMRARHHGPIVTGEGADDHSSAPGKMPL